MKTEFICGCQTGEILTRENIKTMAMVTYDDEGFLICVIHRERRKGWRSVPKHPNLENVRIKKSYFGYTPLQREAHIVFGEAWPEEKLDIVYFGDDVRDNRNPKDLVLINRAGKLTAIR